ncbi:hypothetical protein JOD24_003353 [Kroppenstedtia sanguinis]
MHEGMPWGHRIGDHNAVSMVREDDSHGLDRFYRLLF